MGTPPQQGPAPTLPQQLPVNPGLDDNTVNLFRQMMQAQDEQIRAQAAQVQQLTNLVKDLAVLGVQNASQTAIAYCRFQLEGCYRFLVYVLVVLISLRLKGIRDVGFQTWPLQTPLLQLRRSVSLILVPGVVQKRRKAQAGRDFGGFVIATSRVVRTSLWQQLPGIRAP